MTYQYDGRQAGKLAPSADSKKRGEVPAWERGVSKTYSHRDKLQACEGPVSVRPFKFGV